MTDAPPSLDDLYSMAPGLCRPTLDGLQANGVTTSVTAKLRKGLGPDGAVLVLSLARSDRSPFAAQVQMVLEGIADGAGVDSLLLRGKLPSRVQSSYEAGRGAAELVDRQVARATAFRAAAARAFEQWAGMRPGTAAPATLAALADIALRGDTAAIIRSTGTSAAGATAVVKQVSMAAAEAGAAFDLGVLAARADKRGATGLITGVPVSKAPEVHAAQRAVVAQAAPLVQVAAQRQSQKVTIGLIVGGVAVAGLLALLWPKKKTTAAA
jgi:hypothetical protein